MANIKEYLAQILSARYGKDVRQAIHDSIQQCYYDGSAGTIDLEARQRLDDAEAEITKTKNELKSTSEILEKNKVAYDDIVDNLTSTDADVPLSANQGRVLKDELDDLKDEIPDVLPINKGGTGATTAAGALTNLGLTATAAELNHMDGVTSNVQTQINTLNNSLNNYLPTSGGSVGWLQTIGDYSHAVDADAFAEAQIVLNASETNIKNNGHRAGLGFHNNGMNGAFLYFDDGRFKMIDNAGNISTIAKMDGNFNFAPTDLNEATSFGCYRIGEGHLNTPEVPCNYCQLFVCRGEGDTLFQIIVDYGNGQMYVRGSSAHNNPNGSWSSWRKVVYSDDDNLVMKNMFTVSGNDLILEWL